MAADIGQAGPGAVPATPLEDPEESFVQVFDLDGRLLEHAGTARDAALTPDEMAGTTTVDRWMQRDVAHVDGTVRMLVRRVATDAGALIVVVGQSLRDRDEALRDVRNSFAIGGPTAVLVASLMGYWLARLGLRPVEEMRLAAADISARRTGQRLPLPLAQDEVRRLGQTLNDMLGRLERSFERERSFVSDASHELRTPVAVAKTELEGALRSGDFGPDVGDAIRVAIEECDSLAQLAEDLLVVARFDESGLDLVLEPVRVRTILDGVRDRFVDRATSRGRKIRVVVDGDPVAIGDRSRLRQALGNLVDNALRHGAGTVTLHSAPRGDRVAIDVSDEGPGFTPDVMRRAFDRFTRGDQARARAGAGLGMAIVQALAEAHGGQATITGGSTVRVTVPIAPG